MKEKELKFYMQTAQNAALMSHAVRKKVGACVVTKNRGLYIGYNGSLPGQDNCCEEKEYMKAGAGAWLDIDWIEEQWPFQDEIGRYRLISKSSVVHAEKNALAKMLKEGVSAEGATLVLTLSPCTNCAVMIASAGIKEVVYLEEYRDTEGLEILMNSNVSVKKYNE